MSNTGQDVDHADDALYLREQLRLAQERLAFYQKFDFDVAENVRRSSELMLEAIQVRDRMDHEAAEQARANRERFAAKLQELQADLEGIQGGVGGLLERVISLQEEIETESLDDTATLELDAEPVADIPALTDHAAVHDDESKTGERDDYQVEENAADGGRSIDLIAHGMTRAASALALQSHLRGLSQVETVDAREFSSGILRLHLNLAGDLPDGDLVGWEGDDEVTILRHLDNAIELRIGE